MRRTGLWVLLTFVIVASVTQAQDATNLLTNPGMEEAGFGPYTGRGRPNLNIPGGWNIWIADGPRDADKPWQNRQDKTFAFPHRGPDPDPHGGVMSLNVSAGFHTSTNAVYQQVNVPADSNLTASAWAFIHTCTLPRDEDGEATEPKCQSSPASEAAVRVGIDPNGGTDIADSDIVWSANAAPHDQWLQISTSATATGGQVTVFLYYTSRWASDLNNVYWDDAVLSTGGAGGSAPGAAPPAPTAPPFVAFVVPQGEQEDGSVVHTVQAGDTLDSIAFAYSVTRQDILNLNNIPDPRFIAVGQRPTIRPAGSVSEESSEDESASEESSGGESADTSQETADSAEAPVEGEGGEEAVEESAAEEPEPTEVPPTPEPTEVLPTAPVVSVASGNVQPAVNPAADTAGVCVAMFNDTNQNRIQEDGEALLAGGSIAINAAAETLDEYETDGASEPHCFTDLAAGAYIAIASAPTGYGLTTPEQLRVQAVPGMNVNLMFGAAEGVEAVAPPPAESGGIVNETVAEETDTRSPLDQLMQYAGYILFALAGLALVVGIGLTLGLRRR
jgi:LysM repeat protein